uniref:Uncharacterized protein n=1 Tax=Trichogramma kaykai TaxID=54128 RepID=A0ABD2W5X2_9HYME
MILRKRCNGILISIKQLINDILTETIEVKFEIVLRLSNVYEEIFNFSSDFGFLTTNMIHIDAPKMMNPTKIKMPNIFQAVGSIATRRIFEVRFFAWCGRARARGGAGTTQKEDPGYVISLRSCKKIPIPVRAGSDRITISRSPRRGLTRLAIDGAQHSHDEVRSENHTHKRALDAGALAPPARMMAPEARTTLTRR